MSDEHAFPIGDLRPEDEELLGQLGAQAHAAGNASVALNPDDPAYFMLFDGHTSVPVVHNDNCYICRDPEYAQMGMTLCYPCPRCVRERMEICQRCAGTGGRETGPLCMACSAAGYTGTLGHVAADDTTCDDCGYEYGPWDHDDDGLLNGMPRAKALFIQSLRERR